MRYSPPHTVDISAEPVTAFPASESRRRHQRSAIRSAVVQSLGTGAFLVFVSLLLGVLFSSAIGAAFGSADLGQVVLTPPRWFLFLSCSLPAVAFLCLDALTALRKPVALPFGRSPGSMKTIYAKRIHLMLLGFYFTAILVALCWSAASMPLMSKVFVSSLFSIALYALGQSIPSRRTSFIVSGILFLVVLIATQAFIVLKLEADSERGKQEVLNGVTPTPGAFDADEPPEEGVTQRRVIDNSGF